MIVNLLLVNLAALVISGGVIALSIASLGLEGLAAFLNHSAWVGISVMDAIVHWNVALPGAIIQCPDFTRIVSYLGVLAYTAAILGLNHRHRPLIRFPVPAIVVMATLMVGLFLGGR